MNLYITVLSRRFTNLLTLRYIMSSVSVNEIKIPVPYGHIAAKVWNSGNSRIPILCLHGWMDNAGTWDALAPLMPQKYSLIAIDFPSHGFSSPAPLGAGGYITENILTIERVVRYFNWQKVIIMGHSLGGGSALLYAGTFPDKVSKLIVLDTVKLMQVDGENQPNRTAKGINRLLDAEARLKTNPPGYETYSDIKKHLIIAYNEGPYEFGITEKCADYLLKRGAILHNSGKWIFTADPRLKVYNILSTTFEQQKAFAAHVKCELLVIKASQSMLYEPKECYAEIVAIYSRNCKKFNFVAVDGSHHVHLSNPQVVLPYVTAFLEDINASYGDFDSYISKF